LGNLFDPSILTDHSAGMTCTTLGKKSSAPVQRKVQVRRASASQIRKNLKLKAASSYKIHKLLAIAQSISS